MDQTPFAHSLSLKEGPANPDPSRLLDASEGKLDSAQIEEMVGTLLLGFELQHFAERLGSLQDGLPLPAIFDWTEVPNFAELLDLSADEKRTLNAFQQIMSQERKSSRYFAAFEAIRERFPDCEQLAIPAIAYRDNWDPEAGKALQDELLTAHPDWLLLRFAAASHLLGEQHPDAPDPAALEDVAALLHHRFELHEHLQAQGRETATHEEAFAFYYTTATYFLMTRRFERALYSLNVCAAIQGREAVLSPTVFLFLQLESHGADKAIQEFLAPLQKTRVKAMRAKRGVA